MRGDLTVTMDTDRPGSFTVSSVDGDGQWRVAPGELEDNEGETLSVQRSDRQVLFADPFTGKVEISGSFVTKNICRPPAAVTKYPELRHYAVDSTRTERIEYHLGLGDRESLGFILTPDGRRLAKVERRPSEMSVEVTAEVDRLVVLVAIYLTLFPTRPARWWQRLRKATG